LDARPGEAVPRTDELAVVAAVHAVADKGAQLLRDRALVLDREVRDAAARIELVGAADRLRRAHVDAALAGAAPVRLFLVDWKWEIAVDLAQEKPRASLSIEEQRVLPAPPDSGARSELDLEHRRRVGEHAVAEGARFGLDPLAELP